MASEIRVDKITSLSGVGTISPSSTGVEIAGITTVATLKATTGIVTSLAGNVPVIFAAGTFVKFAADIAGNVPVIFAAGKLVRFAPLIAGKVPVKPDAAPESVVAVHTPVKNTSPS